MIAGPAQSENRSAVMLAQAAHGRWRARYTATLERLGLTDEDWLIVAAPPATVRPGV